MVPADVVFELALPAVRVALKEATRHRRSRGDRFFTHQTTLGTEVAAKAGVASHVAVERVGVLDTLHHGLRGTLGGVEYEILRKKRRVINV